jgi:hypothetical protein
MLMVALCKTQAVGISSRWHADFVRAMCRHYHPRPCPSRNHDQPSPHHPPCRRGKMIILPKRRPNRPKLSPTTQRRGTLDFNRLHHPLFLRAPFDRRLRRRVYREAHLLMPPLR